MTYPLNAPFPPLHTHILKRYSVGVLMVYDITNRNSYELEGVMMLLKEMRFCAPPNFVIMLVGNKCDLEDT